MTVPTLQQVTPIVYSDSGIPTAQFLTWWNSLVKQSLAGLDSSLGLVEQTGTGTFAKRAIGTATTKSIPTLADTDARYVAQKATTAWATPTGTFDRTTFATYAGQTVSNPPTQAQVQAIDDAVKLLSQHLAALVSDLRANGVLT